MKKLLLFLLPLVILTIQTEKVHSQTALTDTRALIWGSSPFQDSLWAIDTLSGAIVYRNAPNLPSFTITGINGIATDPTDGQTYCILKLSAVSGRVLARIDLTTGLCTQVGNLGDNFSSLSFREDGQLFGVTGDGATVPETLYLIDKNTAAKTVAATLGAGADGEIICYNRDDNFFYHWSGNGTVIMEKIISVAPYTTTGIPISGTSGGETFGSIYMGNNTFINSNISSRLIRVNSNGAYGTNLNGTLPDDWRGLVMIPYIFANEDTICENELLSLTAGGHQLYSHLIFHWGDASFDSVVTSYGVLANASHMYSNPGTYTVNVVTWNGFVGDTIYSYSVNVLNIPNVALSGSSVICNGDSVTLTGSSGGTSQWYLNGVIIPGATTNSYSTSTPGVYNMVKTNLNGCSDSAATGINLITGITPVVNLGNDSAYCGMHILDAGNPGSAFLWSAGDTTQTFTVMATEIVGVTVTSPDGCSAMDSVTITINANPTVNLGNDTAVCGASLVLNAGNAGASYLWSDASTAQTLPVAASGMYTVTVTDSNFCANTDTINVVVNALPVVGITAMQNSVCINNPPVPLIGTPAGGTFSGNGVTPNTFTPSVAGAGTWMATYSYTDSLGCSSSDSIAINVNALPSVSVTASSSSVCFDDANVTLNGVPAGGTFSGPGVSGNQLDPSVAGNGTQTVTYMFTDANNCSASATTTVTVDPCVGVIENTSAPFTMFPNPSNGNVTLNLNYSNSLVEVVDVLGNTVSSQRYNNAGQVQLNMNDAAEGIYFVRVTSGNEKSVQKLIIRR
jgi:hypothetical protein